MMWKTAAETETGKATDGNTIRRMRLTGYKHTLRICNTYCFFHCNRDCTHAPNSYVICMLPVLLQTIWTVHTSQYEMGLQVKQIVFRS